MAHAQWTCYSILYNVSHPIYDTHNSYTQTSCTIKGTLTIYIYYKYHMQNITHTLWNTCYNILYNLWHSLGMYMLNILFNAHKFLYNPWHTQSQHTYYNILYIPWNSLVTHVQHLIQYTHLNNPWHTQHTC